MSYDLEPYRARVRAADPIPAYGKVAHVVGLTIEASGPRMRIGDLCHVDALGGDESIPLEVVGFRGRRILLMPLGEMTGIAPGSLMKPSFKPLSVRVSENLRGRVIDSRGMPIDGGAPVTHGEVAPLTAAAPRPRQAAC